MTLYYYDHYYLLSCFKAVRLQRTNQMRTKRMRRLSTRARKARDQDGKPAFENPSGVTAATAS